jgi:hypothetical protein
MSAIHIYDSSDWNTESLGTDRQTNVSALLATAQSMEGTCSWFRAAGRNDFIDWTNADEANLPAGPLAMNCWEFVLVAAVRSGQVNPIFLKEFYKDLPENEDEATRTVLDALGYSKAEVSQWKVIWPEIAYCGEKPLIHRSGDFNPKAGDLIFIADDSHVALSLGSKSNGENDVLHLHTFKPIEKTTLERLVLQHCFVMDHPPITIRLAKNFVQTLNFVMGVDNNPINEIRALVD